MKYKICLDMDGVLANFHEFLIKLFNIKYEDYIKLNSPSCDNLINLPLNEIFNKINKQEKIFENLSVYPWALDLIKLCKQYSDDIIITSKPFIDISKTWTEKIIWLQKNNILNDKISIMLGDRKELLAKPDRILIDDDPYNCKLFKKYRGKAILFPAIYNESKKYIGNELKFVENQLNDIISNK